MCGSCSAALSADAVSCSRLGSVLLCWLILQAADDIVVRVDGIGLGNMSA